MKIENWNGYDIRFVEHNGEWWAIAKDVAKALNFARARDSTKNYQTNIRGRLKFLPPAVSKK